MTLFDEFERVSSRRPCPVCENKAWCLIARDEPPSRALCKRVESPRKWGEAGFLHVLRLEFRERRHRSVKVSLGGQTATTTMWESTAAQARAAMCAESLASFSVGLCVSVESLVRLGIGWAWNGLLREHGLNGIAPGAWSFPMQDALGHLVGIRLRLTDGSKIAITGSRNGLFVPTGTCSRVFFSEGESDAAALLDLGFYTVGKPGAGNCDALVGAWIRHHRPADVVIVGDNDAIGRDKAQRLGRLLCVDHQSVRVIFPPARIKDAREWKKKGADAAAIETVVAAATPIRMDVVVTRKGP